MGSQPLGCRGAVNSDSRPCVWGTRRSNGETPSPATPTAGSGLQATHLNLFFEMVPLFATKVPRSLTRSLVRNDKTLPVDPSQTEPYFEVKISNPYSWRKMISNSI